MTRLQLILVGALSALATLLVLVGAGGASGLSQAAVAALRLGGPAPAPVAVADAPAGTSAVRTSARAATADDAADDEDEASSLETPELDDTGDDESDDAAADEDSGDDGDEPEATATTPVASNIEHVFVITLQGRGLDATFGAGSAAPYLATELRPKGTLLTGFSSLGASDVADRIAFAGGQPPNPATRAGCTTYAEIPPLTNPDEAGEIDADGCVYPNTVISLGDQLTSNRRTWRVFAEDHERGPQGVAALCRRPVSGAADETRTPRPGDAYAAKNNPFVYFHSLLDLSGCDSGVGGLGELEAALADPKRTPNLSYVAPNLCHDGGDAACDGAAGGLAAADGFLRTVVPKILASKAYTEDGLLVITFAGGLPGASDAPSRNGTLLLSRYAQAGGTDDTATDPFGLLRSVEDLLGLKPLARAAGAPSFAGTVLAGARVVGAGDD